MDSSVQLALMTKAERVFALDNTFLSFPITPLSFRPDALDLFNDQSLANLIEFSVLANFLPDGPVWSPTGGQFLWDVYGRILREAEFATSTRTAEEETDYMAACRVLFSQNEDGTRSPTPKKLAYIECRNNYYKLQQDYVNLKANCEAGGDADLLENWQENLEPKLKSEINAVLTEWVQVGFRYEIEAAEATVQTLGAKSPLLTKTEWLSRFDPNLNTLTRAQDQMQVYATSFHPANAIREGSWRSFILSGAEIDAALAQTPTEIRQQLENSGTHNLSSLRFEFSSAGLIRPWFNSEVFQAHFWRFPDQDILLCDGATPPLGLCPYYPVAVIFARHIEIKNKEKVSIPLKRRDGFWLDPTILKVSHSKPLVRQKAVDPANMDLTRRKNVVIKEGNRMNTRSALAIRPLQPEKKPNPMINVPETGDCAEKRGRPISGSSYARNFLVNRDLRLPLNVRQPMIVKQLRQYQLGHPLTGGNTDTSQIQGTLNKQDESIFIFAFICKSLSKCPDPDLQLSW